MSGSDKRNKAVALKYNSDSDMAPVIIASGYGETANKIIEIAEHRVELTHFVLQCNLIIAYLV